MLLAVNGSRDDKTLFFDDTPKIWEIFQLEQFGPSKDIWQVELIHIVAK